MRWLIEAADSKTGLETEITVEARTEADAERLARYNGLLVSKVSRFGPKPATIVPYRGVDVAGPPKYRQLLRSAAWVRGQGLAVAGLGWVGLLAAAGVFGFLCMRHGWDNWKSWRAWLVPASLATWSWAAAAAALVVVGSVLRLAGAVALAVRDVARNTYQREAPAPDNQAPGNQKL